MALSPALAGRIMYDPPLPGVRDQRMPHASAHKMFAIYDEPFWRADGLNAQLISEAGPARMSNDSCLPDEAGGPGIILAFLEGESARIAGRWPAGQRTVPCVRNSGVTSAGAPRSRSASSNADGPTTNGSGAATTRTWDRAACCTSARR